MYVCLECENEFDEPAHWYETHGLEIPPYEPQSGCPYCHGDYVEAKRCDCCGKWIMTDTYVQVKDQRFCENCYVVKDLFDN